MNSNRMNKSNTSNNNGNNDNKKTNTPSVPIIELKWNDVIPENVVLGPKQASKGYTSCDIYYKHTDNKEYRLFFSTITCKVSSFKKSEYNKYVGTMIFDPNYIVSEDPEEQKRLRDEKKREIDDYLNWFNRLNLMILLKYMEVCNVKALRGKTIEEFINSPDFEQDVIDYKESATFAETIKISNDEKYKDSPAPIMCLVLNSDDPFTKGAHQRTNFIGLNEPKSEENHMNIVKRILKCGSEMTPLLRLHRIGKSVKTAIQYRFIHAIVSKHFEYSESGFQKNIYNSLSSDESKVRAYEESKKRADEVLKTKMLTENSNDENGNNNDIVFDGEEDVPAPPNVTRMQGSGRSAFTFRKN